MEVRIEDLELCLVWKSLYLPWSSMSGTTEDPPWEQRELWRLVSGGNRRQGHYPWMFSIISHCRGRERAGGCYLLLKIPSNFQKSILCLLDTQEIFVEKWTAELVKEWLVMSHLFSLFVELCWVEWFFQLTKISSYRCGHLLLNMLYGHVFSASVMFLSS